MRRHFLFILFSLMFACACPFAASAADYGTPWDGAAQAEVTPLLGGAYLVNTAAELAWVAAQDTDYVGWTVVLHKYTLSREKEILKKIRYFIFSC